MSTQTVSTLNDVIETLKDGQAGFRAASEDVQNSELKQLFSKYSLQRSEFAGQLQALAHDHGDHDPANSGSVAGALHRGWIDLRAALQSRDEYAILAECERGEDVAVAAYKKAIDDLEVATNVRAVLREQYTEVKASHDNIKALRDTAKAVKDASN